MNNLSANPNNNNKTLHIDTMTGEEFENIMCEMLIYLGFHGIRSTKKSNDYGVDILAVKDNTKYAFQCKRYSSKVGINAIQEVATGKAYMKCDKAVVITNSYFTKSALNLATVTSVELWDRDVLKKIIDKFNNYEDKNDIIDKNKRELNSKSYNLGDKILHEQFGVGKIVLVYENSIMVKFDNYSYDLLVQLNSSIKLL